MHVELRVEARQDIFDAAEFYESQSTGLGQDFVDSIFQDLFRLEILRLKNLKQPGALSQPKLMLEIALRGTFPCFNPIN
jgi:hypothetical protein